MTEAYFDLPVRVYYEDTDCARVVYYANYLKFMERTRTEWLRALGWSQEELYQRHRIVFVVAEAKVRYIRPAHLDDELIVRARISDCRRASFCFTQEILRAGEKLASGEIRCGVLNADTFRPTAMPEEMSAKFKELLIS
ncbi:tol-pal system-associated acyl-CoA thioesterase [uncultured Parasutterella sp.]|uniref:tol-pal system-associated acyl-CoA thioesterase n=1 Tax=uncultured Parasutterella sp. TaxID=1263098 RepID=UPI002599E6D9|nr:tol-pal system-associated acyl-CoA thioesterase [uncultured Parasutterella sp.]